MCVKDGGEYPVGWSQAKGGRLARCPRLAAGTPTIEPSALAAFAPRSGRLDAFRHFGPLRRRQNRLRVVDRLGCQLSCLGNRRLKLGENCHRVRVLCRRVAEYVGDSVDERIRFRLEGVAGGLKLYDLIRCELELG